jgi:hypothetical protein
MVTSHLGLLSIAALMAALGAGCGGSEAEQACLDLADALASSAERCGFDYDANFDEFVDIAAEGDCANVESVRNIETFESICLPFVRELTCAQVTDPNLMLPEACNKQLRL